MESDAVDNGNKEERPVGATLGDGGVAAVVEGKEDVRCLGKVRQGFAEGDGVGGLGEHEGHGWAEEDDVRVRVLGEVFALEVSGRR